MLNSIQEIIQNDSNSEFIRMGKPRTTLERLFLDEAKRSDEIRSDEDGAAPTITTTTSTEKGADHA